MPHPPRQINRIIYNAEEVFVGSDKANDDPAFNFIPNHQILKRLNRIQSANYSINTPVENTSLIGSKSVIDTQRLVPPEIQLQLTYMVHGIENEKRIGFYIQQDEASPRKNFLSKFADASRNYDARNYYLVTNQGEESIRDSNESYINDIDLDYDLGDLPLMSDYKSPHYDVLCFQNCFLTSYDFSMSVGEMGTCNFSLVGDSASFFPSGSGIGVPVFEPKTATTIHSGENFIIPKRFKESDDRDLLQALIFRNGDVSIDITKKGAVTESTPTYHNDKVQSFSFGANIDRTPISYLTSKGYDDRAPKWPSIANVEVSYLADIGNSGHLSSSTEEKSNYDITLKLKKDGNVIIRYDIVNASLVSTSSEAAIGKNKGTSTSWLVNMDLDNNLEGIFISGDADQSQIGITDEYGNYISYGSSTYGVGSAGTYPSTDGKYDNSTSPNFLNIGVVVQY